MAKLTFPIQGQMIDESEQDSKNKKDSDDQKQDTPATLTQDQQDKDLIDDDGDDDKGKKPDETSELLKGLQSTIFSLQRELADIKKSKSEPPKPTEPPKPVKTQKEKDDEFWKNPTQRISEEVSDQVKPLMDVLTTIRSELGQQSGGNKYREIKDRLRQDPKFKVVFDRAENIIDQAMQGVDVSEESVTAAIISVRGAGEMGLIPGVSFKEEARRAAEDLGIDSAGGGESRQRINPNQEGRKVTLPAHLRPSAPAAPTGGEKKRQYRQLTENEKRIARENHLSDEDYLDLIDVPAHDVVHSKIASKQEKK